MPISKSTKQAEYEYVEDVACRKKNNEVSEKTV